MIDISISRRQFISTGAITLSGVAFLPALSQTPYRGDIIRVGLIGTGSRGSGLASLIKTMGAIKLVACRDIIPQHLANRMSLATEDAKAYTGYRELLEDKKMLMQQLLPHHYTCIILWRWLQ
ncbi:MAG: hypothetical protein ACRD5B_14685, partial [Nitrososphaeraceae archaeon]